jgi:hypothetical protein
VAEFAKQLLALVPADGTSIGDMRLRELLATTLRREISETDYVAARDALIAAGKLATGRGRGGTSGSWRAK